jgi:uncharacterized protein
METEKKHFFLKLNPPRPSFLQDITNEERTVMQEHSVYWKDLQSKEFVIVFGLVFDPKGGFGIGILEVEDESLLEEMQKNDPALKIGNTYEIYPMRAIKK